MVGVSVALILVSVYVILGVALREILEMISMDDGGLGGYKENQPVRECLMAPIVFAILIIASLDDALTE